MRVKTEELISGCILTEDVYCKSARPIMEKNTVLNIELINILHMFLIPTVEVDNILVTGVPFYAKEVLPDKRQEKAKSENTREENDLVSLFLRASQKYKKNFQLWQSGMPIDISEIRKLLLPLLDEPKIKLSEIFSLHHLSNNEEYLHQHAVAVGLLCGFIAKKLNYSSGDIAQTALAGILADCGMAKIRPSILKKKTALTSNEFDDIKNHPKYSYQMVQNLNLLKEGPKVAIIQHHERLDGSGYPFGLMNNKIHMTAKIIAVADTYHAMTSERLFKKKQSPFKVLELMQHDYFGKFDLTALKALRSGIINFSIGSMIKLSNGEYGEVLFISDKAPTRPLVKLKGTEEIINLEENRHLFIEELC